MTYFEEGQCQTILRRCVHLVICDTSNERLLACETHRLRLVPTHMRCIPSVATLRSDVVHHVPLGGELMLEM